MHVKNAAEVNPLQTPHGEVVYELMGSAAGGSAAHSVAHIVIPAGRASRRHYHPTAEESYVVLSGRGRLEMDGETCALGAGDAVAITPPLVHQLFNAGEDDLVILAICVPPWTPDNSVYLDEA